MEARRLRNTLALLIGLCAVLLGPARAAGQNLVIYDAQETGTLGGDYSESYGVNDYGQVVGRSISDDERTHAFHWENGRIQDLNEEIVWGRRILQLFFGLAYDVSNTDHVVGAAQCTPLCIVDETGEQDILGGNYIHATVFRAAPATGIGSSYPGDAVTYLGVLPGGGNRSRALSISNNGLYIVGWSDVDSSGRIHGFALSPQGGEWANKCILCDDPINPLLEDLGGLAAYDHNSTATGVNNHGQVVGWSYSTTQGYQAFIIETPIDGDGDGIIDQWFVDANTDGANDLMISLHTNGGHNSWARSLNNRGVVVGESDEGDGITRAFLWHPDSRFEPMPLGTLGGDDSSAASINDDGIVVGWTQNFEGQKRAFVIFPADTNGDNIGDQWYLDEDQDGANDLMWDLNALLPSGFKLRLVEATDINASGEICGIGESGTGAAAVQQGYFLSPAAAGTNGTGPRTNDNRTDITLAPLSPNDLPDAGGDQTGGETGGASGGDAVAPLGIMHFLCGVGFTNMLPILLLGLGGCKLAYRRGGNRRQA